MKQTRVPLLLLLAVLSGVWVVSVRRDLAGSRAVSAGPPLPGKASGARPENPRDRSGSGDHASAARSVGHGSTKASAASLPDLTGVPSRPVTPEEQQALKIAALEEILADAGSFADLPEEHRSRLALYAGQLALSDAPAVRCWSPDTPREIVDAYLRVEQRIAAAGGFSLQALRVADRWTRTATNSTGQGVQGLPVTMTWSIVPDGTPIPATDAGESSDASSLRARMTAIYGGNAAGDPVLQPWFPVFQAVFDNLAAISGLRFVYEPNDDGVTIDATTGTTDWGSIGIRGDIRLSGHSIDGNSGVLAYAYYPDNGDVVIDTNDSYIATTTNDSIRLRNILEHEIGHSLGLAHVCPVNQTKLMEPFINLGFRGSQFDDVYSHQRNYGDPLEVHGSLRNNDSVANATALPLATGTTYVREWLSIDDSTDSDHFSFSGTTSQQVTVRIIPSDPIAPADPNTDTYLEGAQNPDGSCSAGTAFDPTTQQDLILDLIGTNGSTVVASAPVQASGITEQITSFQLPANGTHYIRVRGGTEDRAQLYRMEVLRIDAVPAPQVVISATRLDAESNSGDNGVPDPDETVRYGITLANDGNLTASNLTATLSAPAGSTLFTAVGSYGTLAPGASGEQLFTFALDGSAGDVENLQLTVTGTGYSVVLPFSLTLGTTGSGSAMAANFDGSSSLPAGWTQSVAGGSPWTISTSQSFSPPNAAFTAGVSVEGEAILVSPSSVVGSNGGTLEFRHRYNLESRFDGAVLEASRNGGAWFDLITSGGTVETGSYVDTIRQNAFTVLSNRLVWTGDSGSFITTRVSVPAAWGGESIAFRWRLVQDDDNASTGWFVDNVNFTSVVSVSDPFRPRVSLASSLASLSENTPGLSTTITLSTPLPLVQGLSVTPDLSGTASAADLNGLLSFVLPAGQTSVALVRSAVADGVTEGAENLVISIPASAPGFAAGNPSSVSLAIADSSILPATVTLSGLSPTYDGLPKSPVVTTNPPGLSCTLTYNGSGQAPTQAGSYAVVATITDPNYQGSANDTLVIGKAGATVTLGSLAATYDGTPKAASVTTNPASLPVTFTYDGSSEVPTAADSYDVVATINDTNFQGTANGTLVIGKALATVTLGSLAATYDGTPKAASVTTNPASLPVTFTYDGSSEVPTAADSYDVVATINDTNYQGTVNGTLVIGKALAAITLGSLTATYDGTPKAASVTTDPADLPVTFTYDGSSEVPTDADSYDVVATINDTNFQGTANGTLVIGKALATVTLGSLSATYDGTPKAASATTNPADLPVTFTYDGSSEVPTDADSYDVVATINDTNYQGTVNGTLVIGKALAAITLGSLSATYDGTPKAASATTDPADLPVTFTYDGSSEVPTAADSYDVVATINDTNYQGTANGTLVIGKALATVTLGNLSATYDGTSKAASATTDPADLPVTFTYDGASEVPTDADSYDVVATINDTNFQGTANGTLVIGKALATVTLGSLSATYDGTPKAASATTDPADLAVTFTYDGSSEVPTAVGSYAVVGTINDPNHEGSASGSLVIVSPYTAWITSFIDPEDPDALPSADLDQDGWDNAGEYAFGSLPDDAGSRPQLQTVLTPTALRLLMPSPVPAGVTLSGETSTSLSGWTASGVTAIPGGFEVQRDAAACFLRIAYQVVE